MQGNDKSSQLTLRIARAGFIQYAAQIFGIATGLIFVTLVTRNLSVEDFGLWQLIGNLAGIALFPVTTLSFWNVRMMARGEAVGKTSVLSAILSLPIVLGIFLALVLAASARIEKLPVVLFAGLIWLPFITIFESLKGIVQALRPQLMGISTILFEAIKVVAAFYLVVSLRGGINGAILALAVAYALQVLFLVRGLGDFLRGNFRWDTLALWLKASWVPAFGVIVNRIAILDAVVVSIVAGTSAPIGFYQSVRVFTAMILLSGVFVRVLYPKLIRDRFGSDVFVAFRLQLILGIPMAAGLFVLAEPLLAVLGFEYVRMAPILRLLSLIMLVESVEQIMEVVLIGAETKDASGAKISFSTMKSSWLVKLHVVNLAKHVVYLTVLIATLLIIPNISSSEKAMAWGIIYAAMAVPFTILKGYYARKVLHHDLPLRESITYGTGAFIMGIVLIMIGGGATRGRIGAIEGVLTLSPYIMIGLIVYFAFVYFADPYFRTVVRNIRTSLQVPGSGK